MCMRPTTSAVQSNCNFHTSSSIIFCKRVEMFEHICYDIDANQYQSQGCGSRERGSVSLCGSNICSTPVSIEQIFELVNSF
nr:MAG TPA: hypothetical protein [Caudoviricetes sp.]DAZ82725.1 MAG TPA: hypothetical protein [Caudoviricetes sp.]